MTNPQKVVIIGAGFGGLGAAILMARAGHNVTVVEQNDKPGGRANLLERDGYRRDMGPSWYLMPDAFERYFHAIGRKVEDYLDLQKLEPSYRVFFKDPNNGEYKTKKEYHTMQTNRIEGKIQCTYYGKFGFTGDIINRRDGVLGIIEHPITGKILLQKKKDGTVTLPGGGVEPGEDKIEALKREIIEETGLVDILSVDQLGDITFLNYRKKEQNLFGENTFYKMILGSDTYTKISEEELLINQNYWVDKDQVEKEISFYSHILGWRRYLALEQGVKNFSELDTEFYDQRKDVDTSMKSQGQTPYLDLYADVETTAGQFEQIEEGSGDKLRKYLASAAEQYDIAMNKFVFKNVDSIREVMKPEMAIDGMKLNIFSSLYNYVSRFVKTENLKKILMYPSVFLGTSPYETPALFNIMSHVDFNQGVFYPQGGIHEIPKALYQIALDEGVRFEFDTAVEKIVVEEKKVVGIQTKGGVTNADIVISNADMRYTETKLLEPAQQTYPAGYRAKKVISPSGFILYLGVDGELPQLQHHTLIFNDDWKEGFAQVFSKPKRPDDPSYYICNPSKTDPTVAPDGKENLFILVPIAPGLESTPESLQAYADFILADISRTCGITDLAERIEVQQIFSIPQFEQYYNAYKGTALGLAHTMFQSAFWRPNNYSKKVKGLYYAGGYTTPGIGMPMCLISAMMVAERIEKNEK